MGKKETLQVQTNINDNKLDPEVKPAVRQDVNQPKKKKQYGEER